MDDYNAFNNARRKYLKTLDKVVFTVVFFILSFIVLALVFLVFVVVFCDLYSKYNECKELGSKIIDQQQNIDQNQQPLDNNSAAQKVINQRDIYCQKVDKLTRERQAYLVKQRLDNKLQFDEYENFPINNLTQKQIDTLNFYKIEINNYKSLSYNFQELMDYGGIQ